MVAAKNRRKFKRTISGYVNVCVTVCLLLLVGVLSPQSSAAPHRNRSTMHRQKRAMEQENSFWANPCNYDQTDNIQSTKEDPSVSKTKIAAVIAKAKSVLLTLEEYKDTFADKVISYNKFSDVLMQYEGTHWLKEFPWFKDELLPIEKKVGERVSDAYVDGLMERIDDVLPALYKTLKTIVGSLYMFHDRGIDDIDISGAFEKNIKGIRDDTRVILCEFSDLLRNRNLEIIPVYESELPAFKTDGDLTFNRLTGLLVYRDTINFLEYLVQVFDKMVKVPKLSSAKL